MDARDVANRLESRGAGVDKPCPICKYDEWRYIGAEGEELQIPVEGARDLPPGTSKTYRVVAIACNRCGFIRFHFVNVLENQPPTGVI